MTMGKVSPARTSRERIFRKRGHLPIGKVRFLRADVSHARPDNTVVRATLVRATPLEDSRPHLELVSSSWLFGK